MIEVAVPTVGESVTEAVLNQWYKVDGESIAVDEPLCELETDKATVDLPAPAAGIVRRLKEAGETVRVGEAVAEISESKAGEPDAAKSAGRKEAAKAEPRPARGAAEAASKEESRPSQRTTKPPRGGPPDRKDAADAAPRRSAAPAEAPAAPSALAPPHEAQGEPPLSPNDGKSVRRVPMSNVRRRIAERLVRAQHSAAMLTTFNEVDMTAVLALRARHKDRFTEAHGVSLGITSFFVRAAAAALKQYPILNARIDGGDIVYHDHVHLGLAVSTERGLVVVVMRDAASMSFGRAESEVKRLAAAARDGKLSVQDLSGGTFTITNGGVFGSLLSTPILNPPETGILGMHAIQKRPVVVGDRIEARDMMYVALTYDHRLVDGKDAVLFLVRVKELLEDPTRMLFES